jgi:hypothetical protein
LGAARRVGLLGLALGVGDSHVAMDDDAAPLWLMRARGRA